MGLKDKKNVEEPSCKNIKNAETNYKYFNKHIHLLKKGINVKVHNGRNENIHNPDTNKLESLWTITEPIYVVLSWKDKDDNNCGFPISFHINTNEFEPALNKFLNIEAPKQKWESYYN